MSRVEHPDPTESGEKFSSEHSCVRPLLALPHPHVEHPVMQHEGQRITAYSVRVTAVQIDSPMSCNASVEPMSHQTPAQLVERREVGRDGRGCDHRAMSPDIEPVAAMKHDDETEAVGVGETTVL